VFVSFFFAIKPNFRHSGLSFVSLDWGRVTDRLLINRQNFDRVELQLKFPFRIRLWECCMLWAQSWNCILAIFCKIVWGLYRTCAV